MTAPNMNTQQPPHYDYSWSIDMLKSLVHNPSQISTVSYMFANTHNDLSIEHKFTVKFLQDVYNPPENNLHLSQQKLQDLHTMRFKERDPFNHLGGEPSSKTNLNWDNHRDGHMGRVMDRGFQTAPNKIMPRTFMTPLETYDSNVNKNRLTHFSQQNLAYNAIQKRKTNPETYYIYPKKKSKMRETNKKITSKASKFIDLVDDDEEPLPIKKIKKEKRIVPNKHLARTGSFKNKSKVPIEIVDSPDSDQLSQVVMNLDSPKDKIQDHHEEERDETSKATTNATDMPHIDEPIIDIKKDVVNNEPTNEEPMDDFLNFDIEELGIKILGEVFLCSKCQKQISQRDVDKGFRETCPACMKTKKTKAIAEKKAPQVAATTETQPNPKGKEIVENHDKFGVLAPLYQSRKYYEEGALTDILDPSLNKKFTPIGKNCQIPVVPLTLYDPNSGRKTRKLWKPDRLEFSVCKNEAFKDDVNGKNSVYLVDEEVTEILVRHRYDVEKALNWCSKTNPEFQYYVKRSANRKRIITRGTGKSY